MPRLPRQTYDGCYHHLIARANNRLFVFQTSRDFLFFKALIRCSKSRFPWKVHHYCLMSNHFHILGYIEKAADLPSIMQFLLLGYSRYYRKKRDYIGHVWQGRYHDGGVYPGDTLLNENGTLRRLIGVGGRYLCLDYPDKPTTAVITTS